MLRYRRFLLYAAVGATGTACQYAILILLVQSGCCGPVPASAAGALAGAIVNYGLNYWITFQSQAGHLRTAGRFALIALAGIALNTALMHLLTGPLALNYIAAQILTSAAVLMLTYSANALWTFAAAHPHADASSKLTQHDD